MSTTVDTSYGKLEGTEENGIRVFRGIPYATGTANELRWRPAKKPIPWAGVRDATRVGTAALQNTSMLGPILGLDIGNTGEDCLHLNVWTPACDGGKRPVLVWIHGGAFTIGAGSQTLYRGETLARRGDVVVVTINYRLGSLGFLHLSEITNGQIPATGNEGLLDQIAALEWVRDEIGNFGGDPEQVTVFGESAGSISLSALLAMPRAQGLFRGAILQSGSANLVGSTDHGNRVAEEYLAELGIERADARRLMNVPLNDLMAAQQRVHLRLQTKLHGLPLCPVVDGEILPQHPFDAVAQGAARSVSMLIGTTLDEMKLFGIMDTKVRSLDAARLLQRCERIIPGVDEGGRSHAARAVEHYTEARAERGDPVTPPDLWFAIDSDRMFRFPAMKMAELQAAQQPQTYSYLFTWRSPFLEGLLGSCHGLEIPFVFGTQNHPMIGRFVGAGPAADVLAEKMQDAWISFAHSGQPGRLGLEQWQAYEPERRTTMVFDRECGVAHAPYEAERAFWESV